MYWSEALRLKLLGSFRGVLSSRGSFGQSVGVLAIGTSIGQATTLLFSPVITRLYTAEQFGQVAAFAAILAFLGAVISMRYEIAILLPEDNVVAANLAVVALLIVVAISLLLGIALLLMPGWNGELAGIRPYMWLIPIAAFGVGTYQVLTYWAVRNKSYSQIGRTKLTQPLSRLATQIALGLLKWGALGLLLGETVGRLNGSLRLASTAWKQNNKDFRAVSWTGLKAAAIRYRRFPLVLTFAAVANTAGSAVPALLLGVWFGPKVLGWYALVDRSMAVPTVLIGQAVSQVYSGEAARLANTDPGLLNTLFDSTIKKLAYVAAIPSLAILLIAPQLFGFVFGQSWYEAGIYARLLVGMQFLGFISWPINPTLSLLERQSVQLMWDIGRGALAVGSLIACHVLNVGARQTIFAYGVAMVIGYFLHIVLSKWAIRSKVRQHSP
jgi:O-antigen/teichoic acid export membrane protein